MESRNIGVKQMKIHCNVHKTLRRISLRGSIVCRYRILLNIVANNRLKRKKVFLCEMQKDIVLFSVSYVRFCGTKIF